MERFQKWFDDHRQEVLENFFTFLKFPSISTDQAYQGDVRRCAEWLIEFLGARGLETELWETSGHPTVFAQALRGGADAPTILFYLHYDVQPVVPLEEWKSDPFEPEVREGKVYARGAIDNKGQCFYTLTAVQALLELMDDLPFNIKLCIEGEEEIGSSGLAGILEEKKEALAADHLIVVDFDMAGEDRPSVTLGLRGIATLNIECRNANADLHSGSFGGILVNPARALTEALAKCWDASGRVTIPGFYDEVKDFSEEELKPFEWGLDVKSGAKPFDAHAFQGEGKFSLQESNWIRPTLEVNGMESGYTGDGVKTIIPSKAMVKLSCRLVPNQDPDRTIKLVAEFIKKNLPDGLVVKTEMGHGARGLILPAESKVAKIASKAYEDVFGKPCIKILGGISIPIVISLMKACGGDAALIGVGLPEDGMHSPNESFSLKRFEQGFLSIARIIAPENGYE